MSPHDITNANFAQLLEEELVRLTAKGWTREQLAADLGYTARQMRNWRDAPPPWALQVGVLTILAGVRGGPPKPRSPGKPEHPKSATR
jgi:hypothetical protein